MPQLYWLLFPINKGFFYMYYVFLTPNSRSVFHAGVSLNIHYPTDRIAHIIVIFHIYIYIYIYIYMH